MITITDEELLAALVPKLQQDPKRATRDLKRAVGDFLKPTYFDTIPVEGISRLLEHYGFDPSGLQGFYTGDTGRINEAIGGGLWITLTWYRMPVTGRYEIIGYLS